MNNESLIAADGALGDTLAITAAVRKLYETYGKKYSVATMYPDIWANNPYVDNVTRYVYNTQYAVDVRPCSRWSCNIISNCFSQLGLQYTNDIRPEIYLSGQEVEYARDTLQDYADSKKIAICLNSSADIRDMRYETIYPLLHRLKESGYKLISVSKYSSTKYSESSQLVYDSQSIFDKDLNNTTLREVFSIINECDMYLGVDTSLFQAAVALNKPQAVFFTNNGCSNNAYRDTYYRWSTVVCSDACRIAPLSKCMADTRCMDNFDLDCYYKAIEQYFSKHT